MEKNRENQAFWRVFATKLKFEEKKFKSWKFVYNGAELFSFWRYFFMEKNEIWKKSLNNLWNFVYIDSFWPYLSFKKNPNFQFGLD